MINIFQQPLPPDIAEHREDVKLLVRFVLLFVFSCLLCFANQVFIVLSLL